MRNLLLIPLLATSLPFATAQAAPADMPETGQTICSDASGATVDCANTGQDGEHRAGVPWPNPRFTVGSGGTAECVIDNLTGLMWMRAPSSLDAANWANALANSNNLTLCGFSDWRLSNVRELESLIHSGSENGLAYLTNQGFNVVQGSQNYWTSTSNASVGPRNTRAGWVITLDQGFIYTTNSKSAPYFYWPVRGGR